jgi:phosphopantothenoylcysteine decarboxylase/phosphopantothenate--cysteine ligase
MLKDLNILLGITGGIAAFKAVGLASQLVALEANVKVVMTQNATQLVGPKSFQAVTGQPVYLDSWGQASDYSIEHIDLGQWADLVVVAPATANILGKLSQGICDDLLSTLLCACWDKPGLMAPAMNTHMWANPAVQRNVKAIQEMGFRMIGPETGRLACGTEGPGRMAEPEQVLAMIQDMAADIGAN